MTSKFDMLHLHSKGTRKVWRKIPSVVSLRETVRLKRCFTNDHNRFERNKTEQSKLDEECCGVILKYMSETNCQVTDALQSTNSIELCPGSSLQWSVSSEANCSLLLTPFLFHKFVFVFLLSICHSVLD